jgi:hypothetical protein
MVNLIQGTIDIFQNIDLQATEIFLDELRN